MKLLLCTSGTGAGQGCSHMLDLLQLATAEAPDEPQLGRDASPDVRRMLQVGSRLGALGIECSGFTFGCHTGKHEQLN